MRPCVLTIVIVAGLIYSPVYADIAYDQTLSIGWSGGNPAPSYTVTFLDTPPPTVSGQLIFTSPVGRCDVDGGTEFMNLSIEGVSFGEIPENDPVLPSWFPVPLTPSQLSTFTGDSHFDVTVLPSGAIGLCDLNINLTYQAVPEPATAVMLSVAGLLAIRRRARRPEYRKSVR